MREKGRHGHQGFLLIASLLSLAVISISSLAIFYRAGTFLDASERNAGHIIAFNMAEAGVDVAFRGLKLAPSYSGTPAYTSMDTPSMRGGYSVAVTQTDENGAAFINPDHRMIAAAGHSPVNGGGAAGFCPAAGPPERGYACRQVIVYAEVDEKLFKHAAYAKTSISLSGNPSIVNGDLATDGTITYTGSPSHNGNLILNPGYDCSVSAADIPSSGSLNIQGQQNVNLYSGVYRYSSLSIGGNGTLTIHGNVTIYVDGAISIAGNGIVNGDPVNLTIIATGGANVDVGGTADFYGAIYAPLSTVTNTGSGDIYGSVIANIYQQSGGGYLHYDAALASKPSPCRHVILLSWRETNILAS